MAVERAQANNIYREAKIAFSKNFDAVDHEWLIDVPTYSPTDPFSYDYTFRRALQDEGYSTFEDLTTIRKQKGLPTHILDVFGSGYFVADYLDSVDSVSGIRLSDPTQLLLESLQKDMDRYENSNGVYKLKEAKDRIERISKFPNWTLIPGNAYELKTWNRLDNTNGAKGIQGYNLIVAKPEGVFDDEGILQGTGHIRSPLRDQMYGLHFLKLLDRAYQRLSSQNGVLITDVPRFLSVGYIDRVADLVSGHGIQAGVYTPPKEIFYPERKHLKLVKTLHSPRNIEGFVRAGFIAA
jgi:hypothetical protein